MFMYMQRKISGRNRVSEEALRKRRTHGGAEGQKTLRCRLRKIFDENVAVAVLAYFFFVGFLVVSSQLFCKCAVLYYKGAFVSAV